MWEDTTLINNFNGPYTIASTGEYSINFTINEVGLPDIEIVEILYEE